MATHAQPTDISTPARRIPLHVLGDLRVPYTLVRGGVAATSAFVAALGWTSIRINGGGAPAYDGSFEMPRSPVLIAGIVVAVAAAMLPRTVVFRGARLAACIAIWVWAGASAVGSVAEWISYVAVTVAFAIAWPRIAKPIRNRWLRIWTRRLRPGLARAMRALPVGGLLAVLLLTVLGGAQPAQAQGNRCDEGDAVVTFDVGGTQERLPLDGSPAATIDLRSGDAVIEFEATHRRSTASVISVVLDRTSPIDLIRGNDILLFHEVIEPGSTEGGEIVISTSNFLRQYEIAIRQPGASQPTAAVPMFTGGAVAVVEVADLDGTLLCRSTVPLRIAGSSWRTPAGLVAIAALGLGAGRACQPLLRPSLVIDPSRCEVRVIDLTDGAEQIVADGSSARLSPGTEYELNVSLRFANLSIDDEAAAQVVDRYDGTIRVRDIGSVLDLTEGGPQLEIHAGSECTLLAQLLATEAASDGTVVLTIGGGEPLVIAYASVADPSASDQDEQEEEGGE